MRKTQGYRTYPAERTLPGFLIRFLARVQELGTVPAIDYEIYGRRGSAGARATTPGPLFAPAQTTRIFVVRADGSGLRQITLGERSGGSAVWPKEEVKSRSTRRLFKTGGPWAARDTRGSILRRS